MAETEKELLLRVAHGLETRALGWKENWPALLPQITVAEACTISRVLRDAAEGPRYFLGRDNDGHWYIVPVAMAAEWEAWSAIPEDDERAWDAPEFAHRFGGAPCLVTFTTPHLEGRPLPPPPATETTKTEEPRHDD